MHVAALFLMTELNQAKERKLAMLVQATVMINAKQSGISERQRGRHQLAYYFLLFPHSFRFDV